MKRLKAKRSLRRQRRGLRWHYVHSRGCALCNLQECYPPRRKGRELDTRSLEQIFDEWDLPFREEWQNVMLCKLLDFNTYEEQVALHEKIDKARKENEQAQIQGIKNGNC